MFPFTLWAVATAHSCVIAASASSVPGLVEPRDAGAERAVIVSESIPRISSVPIVISIHAGDCGRSSGGLCMNRHALLMPLTARYEIAFKTVGEYALSHIDISISMPFS